MKKVKKMNILLIIFVINTYCLMISMQFKATTLLRRIFLISPYSDFHKPINCINKCTYRT